MEQTGIYSNHLKTCLLQKHADFVIENPMQIFKSSGIVRGKTDKTDSKKIAQYLIRSRSSLRLWQARRKIILELAALSTLRTRILSTLVALKKPLVEDSSFISTDLVKQNTMLCKDTINSLTSDLKNIDYRIKAVWRSDEVLSSKMKIMLSVACIGEQTALQMLITTNEFSNISDPKAFACLAGVAPFPYKSGTSIRKRTETSPFANKKVKALLHSCAIVAIQHSPELKDYYERKIREGKSKMSVLNAIRYKLICRVFACVNQNRKFEKIYQKLT